MQLGNLLYLLQFAFAAVIGIYFWNLLRSRRAARAAVDRVSQGGRWSGYGNSAPSSPRKKGNMTRRRSNPSGEELSEHLMPVWSPAKEFTAMPENKGNVAAFPQVD